MTDSPYCKVVEPQPTTFEEAIDKLGYSMSAFRAVLPELPELSSFRLDEAVRLANRVVKRGLADHDRLIGETNQAPLRSQELRRQASSVLSQARVKAALWLLESQVVAFIPVAGELFPVQTLPILARISVTLYGGELGTIQDDVRQAVDVCCATWRVRWKDLQAKRLAREALSKKTSAARRGRPPAVAIDGSLVRTLRRDSGSDQASFAEACRISVDVLQAAEKHNRATDVTISKIEGLARRKGLKLQLKLSSKKKSKKPSK